MIDDVGKGTGHGLFQVIGDGVDFTVRRGTLPSPGPDQGSNLSLSRFFWSRIYDSGIGVITVFVWGKTVTQNIQLMGEQLHLARPGPFCTFQIPDRLGVKPLLVHPLQQTTHPLTSSVSCVVFQVPGGKEAGAHLALSRDPSGQDRASELDGPSVDYLDPQDHRHPLRPA